MDNNMLVSNIRKLCSDHGISISQLERELYMSPGLISRWTKNVPTLDRIMDIANYFDVPLDYITANSNSSPKSKTSHQLLLALYNKSLSADLNWQVWTKDTLDIQISKEIDEKLHSINDCDYFYCTFENGYFLITAYELNAVNPNICLYALASSNSEPVEIHCNDTETLNQLNQHLCKLLHKQLTVIKTNNFISRFLNQTVSKPKTDNIKPMRPNTNIVNE